MTSSRAMPGRRTTFAGTGLVAALVLPLVVAPPAAASGSANEVAYATSGAGGSTIVLRELESGRTSTVATRTSGSYFSPEISPDGQRLVFVARDDVGAGSRLFVSKRDGTGLRRLTGPPASSAAAVDDVSPHWSPDGRVVLFTRISTDRSSGASSTSLFTVPDNGAPVTGADGAVSVPDSRGAGEADYSPDGGRIVFSAFPDPRPVDDDSDGTLIVINSDGSGGRTSLGVTGDSPAWSPDGRSIAFSRTVQPSTGPPVGKIAVISPSGGAARVLDATRPTPAATLARDPSWTPDGRAIVFALDEVNLGVAAPSALWAVDVAGQRAGALGFGARLSFTPSVQGPAPAAVSPSSTSVFTAVSPRRIFDTRDGSGTRNARLGSGEVRRFEVPVPAETTAVVLNVTAVAPSASTDIRVYPTGTGVPGASTLNTQGGTVANLVTVKLGDGGAVDLRNNAGTVDLVADLAGYYAPASSGVGQGYSPLPPGRILDTRSRPAGTPVGAPVGPLGAGEVLDLQVTGTVPTADGGTRTVPPSASAVVLNLTGLAGAAATDLRVYPTPGPAGSGSAVPEVSNLNLAPGQVAANLVTVAVGAGGTVRLRNSSGTAHVLSDLAGYYAPDAPGLFVPVTPTRFLDTRAGTGAAPITVRGSASVDLLAAGTRGVPAGASAVVVNLTATGVSRSTDIRAYPLQAGGVPTVSNLNLTAGRTRANAAIISTGTGGVVRIRNTAGSAHLIADLAGFFVTSGT